MATSGLLWHLASEFQASGHNIQGGLLLFPTLGWAALAAICWLDAFARHRDYLRIKTILKKYGFKTRLFHLVSSSRCQRDAAIFAAKEANCLAQAKAHFHALGYRWYHLLPDPVVDNPFNFFNIHFLRKAFLPSSNKRASTP